MVRRLTGVRKLTGIVGTFWLVVVTACGASLGLSGGMACVRREGWRDPMAARDESAVERRTGDRYDAPGTNPFVVAAHDPLSTFGADVDTASYDVFRRDVAQGRLPDPASVRLEEWVNYFSYNYPAPAHDAQTPFKISLAAAPGPLNADTALLRVAIQAKQPPPSQKRPANLVFLIDTSGSMSGDDRLPLVQHTLTRALDVLAPTDTVAIVTYAGSTGVALQPTPVSRRVEIEEKIRSFAAGGSTAGAAGLDLAYAQAQRAFTPGGINHVVLCTDGDFNVGPASTQELVKAIEQKRKSGITLTVLGFGTGNLNDGMMEAISNKGNGVYGVIADERSANDYVAKRLLSTMTFVAKDLKIQVEFNPDHVRAYRLLGYENRVIADNQFRNDVVDAGEVGAGHRVTALYELVLAGRALPQATTRQGLLEDGAPYQGPREVGAAELVLVKVRYKAPTASERDPASEVAERLGATDVAPSWERLDDDFQWAAAVASAAELIKRSPFADPARSTAIGELVARQQTRDQERSEFAKLWAVAAQLRKEQTIAQ